MKKTIIIITAAVLLLGAGWYFLLRSDGNEEAQQQTAETTEPQDFPARADEAPAASEPEQFSSEFTSLTFSYPGNWNLAEGADNAAKAELYTVESPLDVNEFYFCLDFYVVDAASEESFESEDIEVLSVEPMQNGLNSVIYKLAGEEPVYWNVTEATPEAGSETFTREITGQDGSRLQVFGRFNCREGATTEVNVDEFKESRWLDEAKGIVESVEL